MNAELSEKAKNEMETIKQKNELKKRVAQVIKTIEDIMVVKKDKKLCASIRVFDDESINFFFVDKEENIDGPVYSVGEPRQINQQIGSFCYQHGTGLTGKMWVEFITSSLYL